MTRSQGSPTGQGVWEWAAVALGAALFVWIAARVFPNVDQDAWIYVTYFKAFFDRPFSFQPGHVTFGATSPLHVVVMAPIYHLFGSWWLPAAKLVNFGLVFAGALVVHRASGADVRLLPVTVAACLSFETLARATATLFETGVTFALVSVFVYGLARDARRLAIAAAGLLHLARPELALVTVAAFGAIAVRHRRLFVRDWILACLPAAIYYAYMALSGAGIVPTSVVGRAILAREFSTTWADKIQAITAVPEITVYALGLLASAAAVCLLPRRAWPAAVVAVPIVALYIVVPPGWAYYAPRYLAPVIPAMLFCVALLLDGVHRSVRHAAIAGTAEQRSTVFAGLAAAAAVTCVLAFARYEPWVPYTPDTILQKDLGEAVAGIVSREDRVLMYEIQGQYHFPGHGISADGIVGSEAHDFLLGRQTFDEFVEREQLRFLVSFNAFNYRPIYAGTPLVDIYSHDLVAGIGDELCVGRFCYEKVVGNPHFDEWYVELPATGVNVGTTMRYYSGAGDPRRRNQLIQWNSVYRIRPAQRAGEQLAK